MDGMRKPLLTQTYREGLLGTNKALNRCSCFPLQESPLKRRGGSNPKSLAGGSRSGLTMGGISSTLEENETERLSELIQAHTVLPFQPQAPAVTTSKWTQ